jgi:hypothetical protein
MGLSSNKDGSSAGYGRSCTNCSRAKCKCILRAGGGPACERCHRLGKECQPIITSRKRVAKKPGSSRTAQLEEKFEDLLTILRSNQQIGQSGATSGHSAAELRDSASPVSLPSRLDSLVAAATNSGADLGNPSSGIMMPTIQDAPEPTPHEAEIYLAKFRGWLQNFPFMHLPDDVSAAQLHNEKPFLWLCIMAITSMSLPQQRILKDRIRSEVAHRVVIDPQPSIDLLQGLIAYLTWTTANRGPHTRPYVIPFLSMASSVLYDLGLARSPAEEQHFLASFKAWSGRPAPPKQRTLEERRAAISMWFLTSV